MKYQFFNYAVSNTINGLTHILKISVDEGTGEILNQEVICKTISMRNEPYYSRFPFDFSHVTCSKCYKSYSKHYK